MMKNPFIFGEAVEGENFCDREAETGQLTNHLLNGQKVFLIAGRRIGKTSLVKVVRDKLRKKKIKSVYLDIEGVTTYKRFLESYLNAMTAEFTVVDKLINFLKNVLPGIRFTMTLDEGSSSRISLDYKPYGGDIERVARQVYDLPARIAGKSGFVIVFDEFQEITKLDGRKIESEIRSVVQHQRNVGYVFAGSRRHMLMDMVLSKDRPFYKIGPILFLGKINEKLVREFVLGKFEDSHIRITDDALSQILFLSESIPYYVQMLSNNTWQYGKNSGKTVQKSDVDRILSDTIKEYGIYFKDKWSGLVSSKRRMLQTIARFGGHKLLSKERVDESELGAVSSVQKTLKLLSKDGLIDREESVYYIDDILFREWIRMYTF